MTRPLSRDEIRAVDRRAVDAFGMTGLVLMENAGRNAAEVIHRLVPGEPATVVCGKGNNGGDGFVIARHLERLGHPVRVLLAAGPRELAGDAAANHAIAFKAGIPVIDLSGADAAAWLAALAKERGGVVVDAILGTGGQGPPRGAMAAAIEAINEARRASPARPALRGILVVAIDLPSGMDCDTGLPMGACVRADATVTFVARKKGFDTAAATSWTGDVHVVDIGVPKKLLAEMGISSGTGTGNDAAPITPDSLARLAERARAIARMAHCPFSGYRVGAAVLADDGSIHVGCNVENASYGLAICAERAAITRMVAEGRHRIEAICVYTATPQPAAPCGACRQVIHAFGPDAVVASVCDGPDVLVRRMGELLPHAFRI